jgi:hypothetical protein
MLYYRTAGLFLPGDIVRPGNWGRVVQLPGSAPHLFYRELVLEHLRLSEYPDRPSRLSCSYAFENCAFAVGWQRTFGDHVYPVTPEPGAITFRADMSLVDVPGRGSYAAAIERLRHYWQGQIADQTQVEILVAGGLIVAGPPVATS